MQSRCDRHHNMRIINLHNLTTVTHVLALDAV